MLAPFGSWPSPISASLVASAQTQLLDVLLEGDALYWLEGRPQEGGRQVLVRQHLDGGPCVDLIPAPFSARTRVHEYGGGAVLVAGGLTCFSNFGDQRLYRLAADGRTVPLTPAPAAPDADPPLRYADGCIDAARRLWIGVREVHRDAQERGVVNSIVALDVDTGDAGCLLVHGGDFYSSPRLSPDGRQLAWLTWNHPDMPWDSAQLWIGDFSGSAVHNARRLAGGPTESVFQPEWAPDGQLYFISDRSGWWNLHRWNGGAAVNVCPMAAEFGRAQWGFGMSTYAFVSAQQVVCSYIERGCARLALLDLATGRLAPFDLPFTEFSALRASGTRVAFKAGAPDMAASVVVLDANTGAWHTAHRSTALADDARMRAHFSAPRHIEFETADGEFAHALFYLPANPGCSAPPGELPPLLVKCHGGPTSCASSTLDLRTQFWTSRGIAVVDVDYRGSTGYGRAYRDRLRGMWGVVDVQDCAAAARYLGEQELTDIHRTVITGNSAGGFTSLSCLTSADPAIRGMFKAGGSHYGVSDPATLARITHKFESRYLDGLIGPPDSPRWRERSPLHNAERIGAPVAFFQGAQDRIVPPEQTEQMVAALRGKGITAQYLLFAGEQHGFRQAASIQWALDAELYFYRRLAF